MLPAAIPDTIPVDPTVAISAFAVPHEPPAVASVIFVVKPGHTDVAPVITAGNTFVVAVTVILQPVTGIVYANIGLPAATKVTRPVAEPIVAKAAFEVLHVPPARLSLNVVVVPMQPAKVPLTAVGV